MGKEILMTSGVEIRVEGDGSSPIKIEGYAAIFNTRTTISSWFGTFTESIRSGAFGAALSKAQDVRSLFNHDANYILGRTKSGTLILREDETGLWTETLPPSTPIASSVVESIRRGDVDGMSFAFTVKRHEWEFSEDPAVLDHREILEVDTLYDIGPVTYPAYEATSVKVRDALGQLHKDARSRFEARSGIIVSVPRTFAMYECRSENDEWQPDETKNPKPASKSDSDEVVIVIPQPTTENPPATPPAETGQPETEEEPAEESPSGESTPARSIDLMKRELHLRRQRVKALGV